MSPTPFSLQQIAAAQANNPISAVGETYRLDHLVRLQKLHTAKHAQLKNLRYLFEENNPVFVVQGESSEDKITLHLGADSRRLEQVIHDILDERLAALEIEIVQAHIALEADTQQQEDDPSNRPAHAAAIMQLCLIDPTGSLAASPALPDPMPASAAHPARQAAQRTTTTTTTTIGIGSNPPYKAGRVA